jgi:nucleoside-diphosphate-sugar epimerase
VKALVTGGLGFLGAALVGRLVQGGASVRVLDDGSRGRLDRLGAIAPHVDVRRGDVRDAEAVRAAVAGCDIVWHLAAINGTRHFYERPDDVLDVGIRGTLEVVQAACAAGVRRLVFASSSEVYATPSRFPTPESEPLRIDDVTNPRYSYSGAKIAGELLALHLGPRRGVEAVVVRPHNVYGPDMGADHVIPELIRAIASTAGARRSVEIQGSGREARAFCYVDDAAWGFELAGERGEPGAVYHLGNPVETTVAELARAIGAVMGVEVEVVPGPLRPGSPERRCPDIGRLRALGFTPRVSLASGLARTVPWYLARGSAEAS